MKYGDAFSKSLHYVLDHIIEIKLPKVSETINLQLSMYQSICVLGAADTSNVKVADI
jgi:hypothetical protein